MKKKCKGCYAADTGAHPMCGEPKGCILGYETDGKGHPQEECPKPGSWRQLKEIQDAAGKDDATAAITAGAAIMAEAEYTELNTEIVRSMRRSAAEVVRLGHLLRRMMEQKLYLVYYADFDSYLCDELHMDYTLANRFIGINRKYSIGGNSRDIDEKYVDYSQGLLVEMLNMPPELEAEVNPGMTVKQVREIKRQARQGSVKMKPDIRGLMDDAYCAVCGTPLDDGRQPMECPECGQMQDWSSWKEEPVVGQKDTGLARDEAVVDGEYREIDIPEQKGTVEIATSQSEKSAYGLERTEYPEGSLLTTEGCGHKHDCFSCAQDCNIRQKDRYCALAPLGNPFPCTTMAVLVNLKEELEDKCQFVNNDLAPHMAGSGEADPCCRTCQETCGYRCQRAPLQEGYGEDDAGPRPQDLTDQELVDEMRLLRDMLEEANRLLNAYLDLGDIPEQTVHRQKLLVGALANMVCELEDAREKEEAAAETQQELPLLKNDTQRKQWLSDYKAWGLWYRDDNVDVNYYKFDFSEGSRLVVAEYPQRHSYYSREVRDEIFYHLITKNKVTDGEVYDEKYRHATHSETELIGFLKNLQKKG